MLYENLSTVKIKKQSIIHIFNYNIEKVWNFIKNIEETAKFIGSLISKPTFINGNNSYEKGSYFYVFWRNCVKMYMKVKEILDTDYEKQLIYIITKTEPFNIRYELHYCFLKISENDSILFYWNIIYHGTNGIKFTKEEQEFSKKE